MFIKLTEIDELKINDDTKPCGFRHEQIEKEVFCEINLVQVIKRNESKEVTHLFFTHERFIPVKETPEQIIKMIKEQG